ncbi:hypothetical protein ABW03_12175 [Bacillus altitudinis]|nr:hypothetical protein ABW03_12175 [Bacillus altitudinis]
MVRTLTREVIDENTFKMKQQVIENELNTIREKKFEVEKLLFQQKDAETSLISFQDLFNYR